MNHSTFPGSNKIPRLEPPTECFEASRGARWHGPAKNLVTHGARGVPSRGLARGWKREVQQVGRLSGDVAMRSVTQLDPVIGGHRCNVLSSGRVFTGHTKFPGDDIFLQFSESFEIRHDEHKKTFGKPIEIRKQKNTKKHHQPMRWPPLATSAADHTGHTQGGRLDLGGQVFGLWTSWKSGGLKRQSPTVGWSDTGFLMVILWDGTSDSKGLLLAGGTLGKVGKVGRLTSQNLSSCRFWLVIFLRFVQPPFLNSEKKSTFRRSGP